MKTKILFFISLLMVSNLALAGIAENSRVYSIRSGKAGVFKGETSSERGKVLFDGDSKESGVWLDSLALSVECDSQSWACVTNQIDNTLTLSGNPQRGTILEIFHHTETALSGRNFSRDFYRIKFDGREKILNSQFLRNPGPSE